MIVDIAVPPLGGFSLFNLYMALSHSSSQESIQFLRGFDNRIFMVKHDIKVLVEDDQLDMLNAKTQEA